MEKIEKVMELFQNSNLSDMELELDEFKIKMSKNTQVQLVEVNSNEYINTNTTQQSESIDIVENEYQKIQSKLVGTFFVSNVADGNLLVQVGDCVVEGQVIGVIEAMKVMNEIKSPFNGTVKKINSKNNQLVQYDEVIMEIELND